MSVHSPSALYSSSTLCVVCCLLFAVCVSSSPLVLSRLFSNSRSRSLPSSFLARLSLHRFFFLSFLMSPLFFSLRSTSVTARVMLCVCLCVCALLVSSVVTSVSAVQMCRLLISGRCAPFGVMAGSTVSADGALTTIATGSVGVSPGTAITGNLALQTGAIEAGSAAAINCAADMLIAYAAAKAAPCPRDQTIPADLSLWYYFSGAGCLVVLLLASFLSVPVLSLSMPRMIPTLSGFFKLTPL